MSAISQAATRQEWDYTSLASSYADRPGYSDSALDAVVAVAGLRRGDRVCDVGAGTGHLTVPLTARGLKVDAVEPNDAMRRIGGDRATGESVRWFNGTGEQTSLSSGAYDAVTFGSSFNVTERQLALLEAARLLRPRGWFICMWNHRDLQDPLQAGIESIIRSHIPEYDPGIRRSDQSSEIRKSGLFDECVYLEGRQVHLVDRDRWANGWRSHATVQRQAGAAFDDIIGDINRSLEGLPQTISIPYTTRVWLARSRTNEGA
ncbi:2-methoxy-6-polyprenyl-1,4-benzoquinol methylase, mitochondrial [Austwickia sp. TVS 96-490-7B]|uniref:class I SAM-dependent methyltransferase n=1 Tax=Austwickia sp. TVS 96-490-7B TaxID=2830843 RepID=UPI001D24D5FC|nr:class I SAM-dependent methyltransferase [Austwickia sp. TVS 96-490-7B]MBW3086329.1 2-methoxy-6-polyprenyl-1,4-benzoquinol methylase, mitochondrial [Austwickia sp. TVS 96-490-7B]